jgi:hypothetical protein
MLHALTKLQLYHNALEGTIPSELCEGCTNLTVLWLHVNRMSGPLPLDGLCSMTNLTELSLSENRFECQVQHQRMRREGTRGGGMEGGDQGQQTMAEVRARLVVALPECELCLGDEQ